MVEALKNVEVDPVVSEDGKMKFDSVLPLIGEFGRYQRRIYFLLCLPAISCALHKLAWVFLGAKVGHRCLLPIEGNNATYQTLPDGQKFSDWFPWDEKSNTWSQCSRFNSSDTTILVECDGQYVYDRTKYQSSVFMDFNLVCEDRKMLHSHAQALFMSGILIGSLVFGDLSDRFGRRPIFFLSLVLQVVFGILAGLAPEYYTFVLARAVVGATTSGIFLVGFVIAMEMVGPSKRMVAGVVCQYFFTAGYLFTAIFAFFIRDWHMLQIALSLPGFIFLTYYWFLYFVGYG